MASCVQVQERPPVQPIISAPQIASAPEELLAQLPTPMEGFEWHLYKNAVFQTPIGWHENGGSTNTDGIPIEIYAASPEKFSESKMFEMGVTIQVISDSNKVKSIPAKKIALLYLEPFLETHSEEEILMFSQNSKGDYENTYFRYRDAPPGLKPIIVHKFISASDVSDYVYVFTFESPESTWEENWEKYGTPFLSKVMFVSIE